MQLKFRIKRADTSFGETIKVVGSLPELGNWNVSNFTNIYQGQTSKRFTHKLKVISYVGVK